MSQKEGGELFACKRRRVVSGFVFAGRDKIAESDGTPKRLKEHDVQ